jgi:regulator of protease activity HflC (stomatin/prohibitin superfamily)
MKIVQHLKKITLTGLAFSLLFFSTSCDKAPSVQQQVITKSSLANVRLSDGIPLKIDLSTRWVIEDMEDFKIQFKTTGNYDSLILLPKQLELANSVSIQFLSVDSVFTTQRHAFIAELKTYLTTNLSENGIKINDVIISNIEFPQSFTQAKELLALQEQELERIKKQSVLDSVNNIAHRQRAIAQGEVNIEQAKIDAELEKINAETEKTRRASMLAKAETQKQVNEKNAESEKRRQILMAQADAERQELYAQKEVDKQRKLKDLEIQRLKELDQLAFEKIKKNDELQYANDVQMAELCSKHPAYAQYLVNQELAKNVQIAVLPSEFEGNVFSGLLNKQVSAK